MPGSLLRALYGQLGCRWALCSARLAACHPPWRPSSSDVTPSFYSTLDERQSLLCCLGFYRPHSLPTHRSEPEQSYAATATNRMRIWHHIWTTASGWRGPSKRGSCGLTWSSTLQLRTWCPGSEARSHGTGSRRTLRKIAETCDPCYSWGHQRAKETQQRRYSAASR